MSGHNKWTQIKRQKGATDAKRSKIFTKLVRLLTVEAKKAKGDTRSPGLENAIKKAKEANMPNETLERALKKATTDTSATMEAINYEAYGPGGCALIIEVLTDSRNRSSQEIKHILTRNNLALAGIGAASWAFEKLKTGGWTPKTTVDLSDADLVELERIVDELEANDDVQDVFTNVE